MGEVSISPPRGLEAAGAAQWRAAQALHELLAERADHRYVIAACGDRSWQEAVHGQGYIAAHRTIRLNGTVRDVARSPSDD
jgi:hypothetical protein